MTSLIRLASRTSTIVRTTTIVSRIYAPRRLFADGSDENASSTRGEPAAAVPITPSPFQLTPESLKQQKVVEDAARVPSNHRMYDLFQAFSIPLTTFSGGYTTKSLLTEFGRSCDTKLPDVDTMSWEELFRMNNQKLQKVGMEPTERRCVVSSTTCAFVCS